MEVFEQRVVQYLSALDSTGFVQIDPNELASTLISTKEFCKYVCFLKSGASAQGLARIIVQIQQVVAGRLAQELHAAMQGQRVHDPPVKQRASNSSASNSNQQPSTHAADQDTIVLPGAPPAAAKRKAMPNWSVYEAEVLVEEMKMHEEMLLDKSTGIKYRTMSAVEKFTQIASRLLLAQSPVVRTPSQIEDKWDRMTADFKKVYDWDKHPPSGKCTYWEMPLDMKKDEKLPPAFTKVLFDR
jgi:hypothetical protein